MGPSLSGLLRKVWGLGSFNIITMDRLGPKWSARYRRLVDLWRWSVREVLKVLDLRFIECSSCFGFGGAIPDAEPKTGNMHPCLPALPVRWFLLTGQSRYFRPLVSVVLPVLSLPLIKAASAPRSGESKSARKHARQTTFGKTAFSVNAHGLQTLNVHLCRVNATLFYNFILNGKGMFNWSNQRVTLRRVSRIEARLRFSSLCGIWKLHEVWLFIVGVLCPCKIKGKLGHGLICDEHTHRTTL